MPPDIGAILFYSGFADVLITGFCSLQMEPNNACTMHSHCIEMSMEVHQVVPPPHKSTLQKLQGRLKETFFPDDPLRQFKGQPLKRKLILGAQYVFPILQWGPKYNLKLFKSDLVSGLTIASLAIPQGISYAKLANSSFVPPLVYAVLGSSKDLAVGPVSIASLVMGSMLRQEVSPTADPILFLQLAFTSTLFAGLFQASLGILRLGFIIDFLSKAILIGFMAGAAIIVSLQQLKSLLGITHFTNQMGLIPVMTSVFHNIHEWSWQTILMGICFLVLLLLARHVSIKKPKLFWVSAGAPLMSVIISTLLVFAIKAQNHGISAIGKLQQGINPPSWNMLLFHGSHLGLVMKTGLITGILSLTEGIAVGRTFAALKNYKVDGNKEMMAIGFMNVVGSFTSCYVTTGAFSRSAVNNNAGAKTAVSNVVMSVTVMVTLLFLMPLFQYTPNVVLGAIIVTAVIGLIDLPAACNIWKIDKFDFVVMLTAFLGVLFISVQGGLALAVGLSTFKILLQITRPKTVMLGKIPGTDIYRNLDQYKEAVRIPGFLILSIEAPINFANITYLNERTLRWIEEEEEDNIKEQLSLRFLVLEMSAVSAVDTSGISLFKELKATLEKKGVEARILNSGILLLYTPLYLVLVNPLAEVIEKLKKADEANDFIRADNLFLTVGEAVASLSSAMKGQSSTITEGTHTIFSFTERNSDFMEVALDKVTMDQVPNEVHQVVAPPYKSSLQKFITKVKETFFPDDPLRQFKGQPLKRKLILGAQYVFPVLQWAPSYSFKLFKSDLISGLTIANSSFVPPLVYVVLGSSMDLAVGPVSIASLVLGSMLTEEVSPSEQPDLFLQLALTSTFFAGIFQAALGILRLGFIIDFLSKAILIGFMAGSAVIVALQQLKGLLGIKHFTKKMALVPVLSSVFQNKHEWSWQTILMGVCFLVFLLVARHISIRKPKLFWVSAGAPLVSVIISTVLSSVIKAQLHGIIRTLKYEAIVEHWYFETGRNCSGKDICFYPKLQSGWKQGNDGNRVHECGSFSRSAINHNAGAKTAMSNLVMSVTVLVTLLFLMPLFQYTPNVILGTIIITAVIGLIDLPSAYLIWKLDKFDFVVMLTAFFGVIFISVQLGLAIAVGLSVFRILLQVTRPKTVMLGNIPATTIYRNIHHYNEATRVPGFLILSIEAPINFANITYLNERILRWVDEEEATINDNLCLQFVILEMSAVSAIDTSGVSLFKDLKTTLTMKGLVLVNPLADVIEKLQKADEVDDFVREDYLFMTVGEAVTSLSSLMKGQSPTMEEEEAQKIIAERKTKIKKKQQRQSRIELISVLTAGSIKKQYKDLVLIFKNKGILSPIYIKFVILIFPSN
ncbi:putative sulfate transporter 3.3 [Glycine soja]